MRTKGFIFTEVLVALALCAFFIPLVWTGMNRIHHRLDFLDHQIQSFQLAQKVLLLNSDGSYPVQKINGLVWKFDQVSYSDHFIEKIVDVSRESQNESIFILKSWSLIREKE